LGAAGATHRSGETAHQLHRRIAAPLTRVARCGAVPNRSYLEAHGFGLDRYIEQPLKIEDGFAICPERTGHGIVFDWAALGSIRA
jgi:L-alanine-DL-glutamate epimerase-like enolase superfamily enzyme